MTETTGEARGKVSDNGDVLDLLDAAPRSARCPMAPSTPLLALEWAVAATLFAQLLGLPIAWLKLRRTQAWRKRNPREKWAIGLLDRFIGTYAFAAGITGAAMGLATWLGTTLV